MLQQFLLNYLKSDRGHAIHLDIPIHIDTPDADRKFRMSDAGRCRLYRYWKRQGKEGTKPDDKGLLVMEEGNLLHAWLNLALSQYLIAAELTVEDEHRIGHFDAIIEDPENGDRVLYDYKTISSYAAYQMVKRQEGPKEHHCYQVISYALLCSIPIDCLRIAYVNRDNLSIIERRVNRDDYVDDVENDWLILVDSWKRQEDPAPNPKYWECDYCSYKDDCPKRR